MQCLDKEREGQARFRINKKLHGTEDRKKIRKLVLYFYICRKPMILCGMTVWGIYILGHGCKRRRWCLIKKIYESTKCVVLLGGKIYLFT